MSSRVIVLVAASMLASGCTYITSVDDQFLNIEEPDADTSPPTCDEVNLLHEWGEYCWDGCNNDPANDQLIDCEDPDCEHYCCSEGQVEFLACTDGCDNDHDTYIDCDDLDCTGATQCTPPPLLEGVCRGIDADPDCCRLEGGAETCCSNGLDEDDDGKFDCADAECAPTSFCCGSGTPHVDSAGNGLDADYWDSFGGSTAPELNSYERISNWHDEGGYAGGSTLVPINLDFGLHVSFNVAVTAESECAMPWVCPAFSGIAIGPAPAPQDGEYPMVSLSVLVTSARRVVVTRGAVGGGRILHRIGLPAPSQGPPDIYNVSVDLTPATDEYGQNGYRMRLSVPLGREICHDDGSVIGCLAETEWESDGLVLYEEDNVLISEERGAHLMVLGHGAGVEFSDHGTGEGSETISVGVRSCANPTAWQPAVESDEDDDRLTNAFLCWAVAGLGSGSIMRRSADPPAYAMVVEGTTERIYLPGLGINNFSLGFLTSENDDFISSWDQYPGLSNINRERFTPIDVERDVNCLGLDLSDYADPTCEALGTMMESPEAPDSACQTARSHRSPYLLPSTPGSYRVLYSEAITPGSRLYGIAAADYTPREEPLPDIWTPSPVEHTLTVDDVENATGREYISLRDPAAICHPSSLFGEECEGGTYMVLVAGELSLSEGAPWTGDELIYVEYNITTGFDLSTVFVTLGSFGGTTELNPLAGRYLAEPWIELYDDGVAPPTYFVWVTTSETSQLPQVDLLLVQPDGNESNPHPLVIDAEQDGSGATWTLYPGSPVLTNRDLELLYPTSDWRAVDCSGRCEIGGVTAMVVPNPSVGRDQLHLWVSMAERPSTDEAPRFWLRHLVQPFGLP
jgi:hypothetical protein